MSYKGDKIAAAFQQFSKSDAAHGLEDIASTLTKRPLGEKHFDRAKATLEAQIAASKEIIYASIKDDADSNPFIPLRQRLIDFNHVFIAVTNDHNQFIPAGQRVFIRQRALVIFTRAFPVRLNGEHVEYRHVERSAKALYYREEAFKSALSFSLLLSKTLESIIPKESTESIPIVIPQPGGLFLGTSRRAPPEKYKQITALCLTHYEKKGVEGIKGVADWLPEVETKIKTYVHARDFHVSRQRLFNFLKPFYEEIARNNLSEDNINSYVMGTDVDLKLKTKENLAGLTRRLGEIVQSKEWTSAVRDAVPLRSKVKAPVSPSTHIPPP